jgi:hypothetical protein
MFHQFFIFPFKTQKPIIGLFDQKWANLTSSVSPYENAKVS